MNRVERVHLWTIERTKQMNRVIHHLSVIHCPPFPRALRSSSVRHPLSTLPTHSMSIICPSSTVHPPHMLWPSSVRHPRPPFPHALRSSPGHVRQPPSHLYHSRYNHHLSVIHCPPLLPFFSLKSSHKSRVFLQFSSTFSKKIKYHQVFANQHFKSSHCKLRIKLSINRVTVVEAW